MSKKKLSDKMKAIIKDEVRKVSKRLMYENNAGVEPMESIGVHQNEDVQEIADTLREESMTDEELKKESEKYNKYMRKNRWK